MVHRLWADLGKRRKHALPMKSANRLFWVNMGRAPSRPPVDRQGSSQGAGAVPGQGRLKGGNAGLRQGPDPMETGARDVASADESERGRGAPAALPWWVRRLRWGVPRSRPRRRGAQAPTGLGATALPSVIERGTQVFCLMRFVSSAIWL